MILLVALTLVSFLSPSQSAPSPAPAAKSSRAPSQAKAAEPAEARAPAQAKTAQTKSGQTKSAQAQDSRRGWLGVVFADDGESGIAVQSVSDGSPAAQAGLQAGDRVMAMDGEPCDDYDAVVALLRERGPGARASLRIRREVQLQLDEDRKTEDGRFALGVSLGDHDDDGSESLRIDSVSSGYPAAHAGLRAHDRLVAIDGKLLDDYDDLVERMTSVEQPTSLRVQFERELPITLGSVPATSAQARQDGAQARQDGAQARQPRTTTPRTPEQAPAQRPPQSGWQMVPPGNYYPSPSPSGEDLSRELRELSDQLRELRDELAQLRSELQALRDRR